MADPTTPQPTPTPLKLQAPDGRRFSVNIPTGASQQEIDSTLQSLHQQWSQSAIPTPQENQPKVAIKGELAPVPQKPATEPGAYTKGPTPVPLPPGPERQPWGDKHPILATGLRVGAPYLGRAAGTAAGAMTAPVTGPAGALVGGYAGQGLASMAAEPLAQMLEGRDQINWAEAPVQGAIAALPLLGSGTAGVRGIVKQGLSGAAQGVAADVGLKAARGEPQSLADAVTLGAMGGTLGAGAGTLEKAIESGTAQRLGSQALETIDQLLPPRARPPQTTMAQEQLRNVGEAASRAGFAASQIGERGQPVSTAPFVDMERVRDTASRVATGFGQAVRRAFDWYTAKPRWDQFDRIMGDRNMADQLTAAHLLSMSKDVKELPHEWRRAMSAFHDLKGDPAALQDALQKAPTAALRRKYENALALPPELQQLALAGREYYDRMFDIAANAGVLDIDSEVENYLNRLWHTRPGDDPFIANITASSNSAPLQINPDFTYRRIMRDMNEAEIERLGYRSNDDYGFRLSHYYQGLQRAVTDRKAVKDMFTAVAGDGRPLVGVRGSGTLVGPAGEHAGEALLINPAKNPADMQDYLSESQMSLNIPQLRNWRWLADAPDGTPVLMRGEAVVHPEYAKRFAAYFGRSRIRTGTGPLSQLGRTALKLSNIYKSTMFSLSGFHQTAMAEHAWAHGASMKKAFTPPQIPWQEEHLQRLVKGGMMLVDADAHGIFSEGLAGGLKWVPGIGQMQEDYTSYLFQDYIPRLKAMIGQDALERNTTRYSQQLSPEQIARLTARQMNDAFGELDWAGLGLNKTTQDAMRLMFTAPDFNLARQRFLGSGLLPFNAEQRTALMRIGLANYVTSRIMNKAVDGNYHWHDIPFGYKVGDTVYTLRTIAGDAAHEFGDPRSFLYHRLNPLTVMPFVKTFFGDIHGQQFSLGDVLRDTFSGISPIPGRGVLNELGLQDGDQNILQGLLSSAGVSAYPYRDPVEKAVDQARAKHSWTPTGFEVLKARHAKSRMVEALRNEKEPDPADVAKLSTNQQTSARAMAQRERFAGKLISLPFMDLAKAYELAKSGGFEKDAEDILRTLAGKKNDPLAGVNPPDMEYAKKMLAQMQKDAAESASGTAYPEPDLPGAD